MQRTRVLQHRYNASTQKWSKSQGEIQMETKPFAEGSFRAAYRAWMSLDGNGTGGGSGAPVAFVLKFAKDPQTPRSMYFSDVEAHEIAHLYARKFSAQLPATQPPISYVSVCVLELVDRPGRPVCGCEQMLDSSSGVFRKYNNNVGAVCAMSHEELEQARKQLAKTHPHQSRWDPQATAQAFSHYSWDASGGALLICDIQGVLNRFTDPQIHTMSGKGFGLGNLGQTGIRAFMLRHVCTDLCRAVGLTPIQAKDLTEKSVGPNGNVNVNVNGTTAAAAAAAVAAASAGSAAMSAAHLPSSGRRSYNQQMPYHHAQSTHSDILTLDDGCPSGRGSGAGSGSSSQRGMNASGNQSQRLRHSQPSPHQHSAQQQQQQAYHAASAAAAAASSSATPVAAAPSAFSSTGRGSRAGSGSTRAPIAINPMQPAQPSRHSAASSTSTSNPSSSSSSASAAFNPRSPTRTKSQSHPSSFSATSSPRPRAGPLAQGGAPTGSSLLQQQQQQRGAQTSRSASRASGNGAGTSPMHSSSQSIDAAAMQRRTISSPIRLDDSDEALMASILGR